MATPPADDADSLSLKELMLISAPRHAAEHAEILARMDLNLAHHATEHTRLAEDLSRQDAILHRELDAHEARHQRVTTDYQRERLEAQTQGRYDLTQLEIRFKEHQDSHEREHVQAQIALDKASDVLTERFHSVNEFRQSLTEQAATFARAESVEQRFVALQGRMETGEKNLNERRDSLATQYDTRLAVLEKYMNSTTGHSGGSASTVLWALAGISALGTMVGIISVIVHFLPVK